MAPIIQSARLATGVRLDFVQYGDPAGIPLLFLPGLADSWRSFEHVLPLLSKSIHAIAVTRPGHGAPDHPPASHHVGDFAADSMALLDTLGIHQAVIVGHSHGAVVARQLAVRHRDRVAGTVFVGLPSIAPEHRSATEHSLEHSREHGGTHHEVAVREISAELNAITSPMMLMWGDADPHAAEIQRICDTTPEAIPVIYSGVGDALHCEDPELFGSDLSIFAVLVARGPLSTSWNSPR
ncbi:alpha/beta fold hydrolase [Nonomuraea basaltis]|uniref:alpha/beta fold hydrolase n=1 Tax=Nonomuraea basaltis TaxID=2495887 RepID=UPI00110C5173|nr:alpha/beta fold hydrolase [Nonomuraea basaltis]TMR96443.1 alpha/beta fold hydrolase [Nonomuraea basaltis]